jgi:AAA15 family ATPase/GTPase
VENNIQLFTTTHSLEAVDTILDVSNTTDLVSYRLQQRDLETTAKRFDKDLLKRLREDLGREVRW